MKLHRIAARALSGLALASFVSMASISVAAAGTPAVILIVNSDQLFSQSKVGQNVREQIQTLSKKLQSDSVKAENNLKEEAKKLGEQRALLKEEDFAKKVQAFQKKEQETQQSLQARGQALQLGANVARNKVEEAIRPIFADILKTHNANILLDQSTVLAGGVDLDVTAEIVKALDAKLTAVKVTPTTPADLKK